VSTRAKIQKLINTNVSASDVLDDLVHETASQAAAATNNKGLKAQLEFLDSEGLDEDHVLNHIEESIAP
jgi:hypothetical protein